MTKVENITFYEFVEERPLSEIRPLLGNLYEVFLSRNLIKYNSNSNTYNFNYAGFAVSKNNLVVVFPKYLYKEFSKITNHRERQIREYEESKNLYKLLKRNEEDLKKNSNIIKVGDADFFNESNSNFTNELAIAEFILNDYQMNGIWNYNTSNILLNAPGEADWNVTIDNIDPIISNGNIIYGDTYNKNTETVTNSLITEVHKFAIEYCSERYSFLLDISLSGQLETANDLEDIGEQNFLLYRIEKQLSITYQEREILLLKNLAELINIRASSNDDVFSLYGRRDFEQVWETALQFTIQHDPKFRKTYFPPPEWYQLSEKRKLNLNVNHALKPDILRLSTFGDQRNFLILDAKYYLINYDSPSSFPMISDIVKQYFYEAALIRKDIGYQSEEIINGMIFPSQEENFINWYEPIGHVRLDNDLFMINVDGILKRKPILIYFMSPNFIFNKYISSQTLSDQEILVFVEKSQYYIEKLI